ncbi:hypothetical protein DMC30DRAFT_417205 [Rhodotorula diobovata]|uniref:Uncharacterized protein n=1 Tax=Rhodotorula diobovata TaxID=5288 RepID=A0A5C5FTD4_9BASI|nr:hypothetical protein DMC30DRAFT_417205 [Rhodotorula diobovata]
MHGSTFPSAVMRFSLPDERTRFDRWMDESEDTWDEVKRTEPAGFALALVLAEKADRDCGRAQCDPSLPPSHLPALEAANQSAKAARRRAESALVDGHAALVLTKRGGDEMQRLSEGIKKCMTRQDEVEAWAQQASAAARHYSPHSPDPASPAAYATLLEKARLGAALARYLGALESEADDFLRLRCGGGGTRSGAGGAGTGRGEVRGRTVEGGSALGRVVEREEEEEGLGA